LEFLNNAQYKVENARRRSLSAFSGEQSKILYILLQKLFHRNLQAILGYSNVL